MSTSVDDVFDDATKSGSFKIYLSYAVSDIRLLAPDVLNRAVKLLSEQTDYSQIEDRKLPTVQFGDDNYKTVMMCNKLDGLFHSIDDEPAVICTDGSRLWYKHGKLHRDELPAFIERNTLYTDDNDDELTAEWYLDGVLHRNRDLPAVIKHRLLNLGGNRQDRYWKLEYWLHGRKHRGDNKPAVQTSHGLSEWWICGAKIKTNDTNPILSREIDDIANEYFARKYPNLVREHHDRDIGGWWSFSTGQVAIILVVGVIGVYAFSSCK